MSYTPTIGLEVHAELKTKTKMFCNSPNDPHAAPPNTNICAICMGFPGTLPVINKEAVRHVLRVGAAVNGTLADYSEFDRKNYFYPDLPKGYQISQYQYPLVSGGSLAGVALTRVHLEEDTARSQHPSAGSGQVVEEGSYSLIDFNRAGVPLMELVTEPVIHDEKTAERFAQELQLLLRTLRVSEANMEKGEMRVEANISVSADPRVLGTKVEVKNLNSFRSVGGAIEFEIRRQVELLARGEPVVQETRGWDEDTGATFSQRVKEDSHDYRYFPDPDLPELRLSRIAEFSAETITSSLPELHSDKRERLLQDGMDPKHVEVLLSDPLYASVYDRTISQIADPEQRKMATNILFTTVRGMNPSESELLNLNDSLGVMAETRANGSISSTAANIVIAEVLKTGRPFAEVALEKGLFQIHDEAKLKKIVAEVIFEHKDAAEQAKAGKIETVRFLIGQGMRKSKGSANPQEIERLIKEELKM